VQLYIHDKVLGYVIVLPSVNKGTYGTLRIILLHIALEQGNFIYINTDKAVLCFDRARQYHILIDEAELEVYETVSKSSHVCKQRHPLFSSHSVGSCTVRMLKPRCTIPKSCDSRLLYLLNTLWNQLRDNAWIYLALRTGTISDNSGCKGYRYRYSVSEVIQANSTAVSNRTLQEGDLLSQVSLQYECYEDFGINFNLSGFSLDIPHKNIIPHLDDLKYAGRMVSDLALELKNRNGQYISCINTTPILL
jgi:hypothetical protein